MTQKICTFLGFKNRNLITVIQSIEEEVETAIDCDYYVAAPERAEKQIADWKTKLDKPCFGEYSSHDPLYCESECNKKEIKKCVLSKDQKV